MPPDPTPDAQGALALADEALSRFEVEAVVAHLSTAIRGFTAARDHRRAAMASVRLGQVYADALGNTTAARALFVRARRLVEDDEPCVEQGWVAIAAMGCDVDDPAALLAAAELALDRARRFGDVNLETKALADAGLAHVQAGRVEVGMALLDEAMVLACGPADDGLTAAKSVCSFFTACCFAADFGRASTWAEPLRRRGLIGASGPGPAFLSAHCDSVHATLLVQLGRWGEAEAVLVKAQAVFEAVMPAPAWHPAIVLASLRVWQGRLGEAEALLLGKDQTMEALLPAARLHLARGDVVLARAAAERGLRALGDDRLRAVELLVVLVEAELLAGDLEAAARAGRELERRAEGLALPAVVARATAARARILSARGDAHAGVALLAAALEQLDAREVPWLLAVLLLELGRLRLQIGDRALAVADGRSAAALLAPLDVALTPAELALLGELGVGLGAATVPPCASLSPIGGGKWWSATFGPTSVRLSETKGLRYLAELLVEPHVERHALDLIDRVEGVDPERKLDRRSLGGSGPAIDAKARLAYRERIEALRARADDALAEGRLEAAQAAQGEIEELVGHLAAAFGLGGRARPSGGAAEKARLNVTRALRAAIAKLQEALPEAGAVLDRRVRTGLYCTYAPGGNDEIRWLFSRE